MKNAALLLVFTVMCAGAASAQQSNVIHIATKQDATVQMSKPPIRQGSMVQIVVTVNEVPNTNGRVYADVGPADETSPTPGFAAGIGKGQTEVTLTATLPLDAKLGKWVV